MEGSEEHRKDFIVRSKWAEHAISDRRRCGVGQLGQMGRDVKPLFLKVGLALAISAAGFIFSQLDSSRRRRFQAISGGRSPETLKKIGGESNQREAETDNARRSEEVSSSIPMIASLLPSEEEALEEEGFLLPEFKHLSANEFDMITENNPIKPTKEEDRELALQKEVETLREILETDKERGKPLESQLVEYYELKNQEAAIRELESRVKISAVESHLLSLKIQSLQAKNHELEARLLDYSNMSSDLEAAKKRIEFLKVKMKANSEDAAIKLSTLLHHSVEAMIEKEKKEMEVEFKMEKRIKALESETDELKRANSLLVQENSELLKRWEEMEQSMKTTMASSDHVEQKIFEQEVSESQTAELVMREENCGLKQEIEQLKMDRFSDLEELVYLRWINACLRYETRKHKPPMPGKTIARDLSKTPSPESERKAKQLILEYANDGDYHDASSRSFFSSNMMDLHDFECWSSQGSSSLEELSDIDPDKKKKKESGSRKMRLLSKFRSLVVGKEEQNKRFIGEEASNSETASCVTSVVDLNGFGDIGCDESKHHIKCSSDLGEKSHLFHRRIVNQEEDEKEGEKELEEKARLKKYAEALSLKEEMIPLKHSRRRAVSLSFW